MCKQREYLLRNGRFPRLCSPLHARTMRSFAIITSVASHHIALSMQKERYNLQEEWLPCISHGKVYSRTGLPRRVMKTVFPDISGIKSTHMQNQRERGQSEEL